MLEEAPAAPGSHGQHHGSAEAEAEAAAAASIQARAPPHGPGLGNGEEPIRVKRTADPLVLQVWFGCEAEGGGGDAAAAAAACAGGAPPRGPRAFVVRVPRFYPHSVRAVIHTYTYIDH